MGDMGLKVTGIIDGDTFEVFPPWRWEGQSGIRVKVAGLSVPQEGEPGYSRVRKKLESIILGREVELRNERGVDYDRLVCDVYFDGRNLVDYF